MMKSAISKFEEFLSTNYKEEILSLIDKYPKDRFIEMDYNLLNSFNQDLADLLIEKPQELLDAAGNAIKNIDPLLKEVDIPIRVANLSEVVPLYKVNSQDIGRLISTDVVVYKVNKSIPRIKTAIFECRACMRLVKVEQTLMTKITEPAICPECGNRSFRLLQDESDFIDRQVVKIKPVTPSEEATYPLTLILENDLIGKLSIGDRARITGIYKLNPSNKKSFCKFIHVNYINSAIEGSLEFLKENEDFYSENEEGNRKSKEYVAWRNEVISRDLKCVCCGGDKHLEAHHIFGYKENPEYRVNIDNGVTLCKWCHGKYHSYYGKEANPVTLISFINRFGGLHGE